MSAAKHTPGPWAPCFEQSFEEWTVFAPRDARSDQIAFIDAAGDAEENAANAKLIAAAPALADALEALSDLRVNHDVEEFLRVRDAADAALRAAGRLP